MGKNYTTVKLSEIKDFGIISADFFVTIASDIREKVMKMSDEELEKEIIKLENLSIYSKKSINKIVKKVIKSDNISRNTQQKIIYASILGFERISGKSFKEIIEVQENYYKEKEKLEQILATLSDEADKLFE